MLAFLWIVPRSLYSAKACLCSTRICKTLLQGVWRCPACQDLCNCSGATCSRYQKGLEPTEQLHHEAVGKGFKSVSPSEAGASHKHLQSLC